MTTYRGGPHADLVAAVDKAYRLTWLMPADLRHLDTLNAILITTKVWRDDLHGAWDSPAEIMERHVARALAGAFGIEVTGVN